MSGPTRFTYRHRRRSVSLKTFTKMTRYTLFHSALPFLIHLPKMTVTYQVGEGGHLDIDFWVRWTHLPSLTCQYPSILLQLTDPEGSILTKHIRQSTGSTSITAEKDGRHEYCFSNQMSTMADKEIRYAHRSRVGDASLMHTIVLMFTVSYTSRKMVSLLLIPLPC